MVEIRLCCGDVVLIVFLVVVGVIYFGVGNVMYCGGGKVVM